MERIITVSNRLPVTVSGSGKQLKIPRSTGGLATGILNATAGDTFLWIGWEGITTDDCKYELERTEYELTSRQLIPVNLNSSEIELFIEHFSNNTISSLSKGKVVRERLNDKNNDFIFCAGDDRTDEDMFKICHPMHSQLKSVLFHRMQNIT
jgi:trehalose-6-phosphate synthase